jgi:outer membrane protein OmpA-like peptidoglycan-associated protein
MSRTAIALDALLLSCGVALSACALFSGAEGSQAEPPRTPTSGAAARRMTQLDFGRDARYAHCVEPACPTVTRKTLAVTPEPAARPVAAPTAATAASAASVADEHAIKPGSEPIQISAPHTLVLHFGINSAALSASHKALLRNALSELLRTDRIVIAGRTDDLGSEALNQSLAFARALAIRDHLLDLAPDLPARIAIDAKGRCCYAVANDSEAARARNRRVEIAFTPRAGAGR